MGEGNILSLSTLAGRWGVPHPRSVGEGRVPHPRTGWGGGTMSQICGGGTPSQVWVGGTPSQVWMVGGTRDTPQPGLDGGGTRGTPTPPPGLDGVPPPTH